MKEFQPYSTDNPTNEQERTEAPEPFLSILSEPDIDDQGRRSLRLATTYESDNGEQVEWQGKIGETQFFNIGKIAELPAPLPEINEKLLKGEDRDRWEMRKAMHKVATVNARSNATYYALALLDNGFNDVIDVSVRGQLVDQLVVAAESAYTAQKTIPDNAQFQA